MLGKKTCLLLGAGASSHLGFPLGSGLKEKILKELESYLKGRKQLEPSEEGLDYRQLKEFFDGLAFGTYGSPDAYLEDHPAFMKIGKGLITKCLADIEDPYRIAYGKSWYDQLVEAINVEKIDLLSKNDLSIVTFNYDRSLDFRLHKYIENRFKVNAHDAFHALSESIPIVHVHGTIGEYPKFDYGEKSDIETRANELKIIHEVKEESSEFQRASALLHNAERVVVLGFGFGDRNVRRLKYFNEGGSDEKRDIIIAAGTSSGGNDYKNREKSFRRWGLAYQTHCFDCNANDLMNAKNPFVD